MLGKEWKRRASMNGKIEYNVIKKIQGTMGKGK